MLMNPRAILSLFLREMGPFRGAMAGLHGQQNVIRRGRPLIVSSSSIFGPLENSMS